MAEGIEINHTRVPWCVGTRFSRLEVPVTTPVAAEVLKRKRVRVPELS